MNQPPSGVAHELERILNESDLQVLFQTIVSLHTGQAIGFDAAVRGPSGSPLYAPSLLIGAAERGNRLADLERLALRRVLEDVRLNSLAGTLFHRASLAFLSARATPVPADLAVYRSVKLTHSCATMNKVDFLLHRGRFRAGLATRASAFLSTGCDRGTRGQIGEVNRRIQVPIVVGTTGRAVPVPYGQRQGIHFITAVRAGLAAGIPI